MYSLDQRIKAVELYIKYHLSAAATIRELGYPNRHTLKGWYLEYQNNNSKLKDGVIRKSKFTEEQRQAALQYYLDHGRNVKRTVQALGYPGITTLKEWIYAARIKEKCPCLTSHSVVHLTQEQKIKAVIALCTREESVKKVAENHSVSSWSLYNWAWHMFGKGNINAMPKPRKMKENQNLDELQQLVSQLSQQAEDLQRQVYRLQLEKDVLEKANELIKKEEGVSLEMLTNHEKAIVIGALRSKYPLQDLLKIFNIAKSSYFYQQKVLGLPDKYINIRERIKFIFYEVAKRYGYRRIHRILINEGIIISEKIVRRIMQEENLVVYHKRRRKYSSYVGEISPAVPNIVNRNFHADKPNEKWLTDITEFAIPAGKVYLSPIIDCFDGLPVSWTIGTSPNANLANSMLDQAISLLKPDEHPLIHSDRGSHYRWPGWISRMDRAGLIRSMSKKGCSPDNSACEGFFGRIKNEMFYGLSWEGISIEQFIKILDDYIHWYAEKRIKMSLGGLSPIEYRRSLGLIE